MDDAQIRKIVDKFREEQESIINNIHPSVVCGLTHKLAFMKGQVKGIGRVCESLETAMRQGKSDPPFTNGALKKGTTKCPYDGETLYFSGVLLCENRLHRAFCPICEEYFDVER
jgi:hypothetical protein